MLSGTSICYKLPLEEISVKIDGMHVQFKERFFQAEGATRTKA